MHTSIEVKIYTMHGTLLTGRKEENILFNEVLGTFYLWLYGVRHIVKDHSSSERVETCCHTNRTSPFHYQQGIFYMHHPTDRIAHTMNFVISVMEHRLELK